MYTKPICYLRMLGAQGIGSLKFMGLSEKFFVLMMCDWRLVAECLKTKYFRMLNFRVG